MRPLKISLAFAAGYIMICGFYVWFSGRIAAKMSQSIMALGNIELYKGLIFVLVTGALIFALVFTLLLRIGKQNRELDLQRKALVQSQSRALAGTLAAGIAHDMNNILCSVDFSVNELRNAIPPEKQPDLDLINRAFLTIRDLSSRLQTTGENRVLSDRSITPVSRLIDNTIRFAKHHRKCKQCVISYKQKTPLTLEVNAFLVEQMLLNLILNAAEATDSRGKIEIRVGNISDQVSIEIHDNGPGIPEKNREALFRPYTTTKTDGKGLGLMMVRTCAELHGGKVETGESDLGGALFRIVLPTVLKREKAGTLNL